MLSIFDKFLIVSLLFILALESGVDGIEAAKESNWIWAGVCVIAAMYVAWLGVKMLTFFFGDKDLPVK